FGGNVRDLGPVSVTVGPRGDVVVAYVHDRISGGPDPTSGSVVTVTRECDVSLLTGTPLPGCAGEPKPYVPPSILPPTDGVPNVPRLACSPLPPPFPETERRPVPRTYDRTAQGATDASGPAALAGLLVPAVPPPVFTGGHAPAHSVNS